MSDDLQVKLIRPLEVVGLRKHTCMSLYCPVIYKYLIYRVQGMQEDETTQSIL